MFEVGGRATSGSTTWTFEPNTNDVSGRCASPTSCDKGVSHLGAFDTLEECQAAVNGTANGTYTAYTYHQVDFGQPWGGHCYGVTDGQWSPRQQDKIDSGRAPYNDSYLTFSAGGIQGGEGVTGGENWYIENVAEELDAPREWFFDADAKKLIYKPNATAPGALNADGTPAGNFVATHLKQLFTVVGTQDKPVRDVSISGLTLRDTAYTYMDPHGEASESRTRNLLLPRLLPAYQEA